NLPRRPRLLVGTFSRYLLVYSYAPLRSDGPSISPNNDSDGVHLDEKVKLSHPIFHVSACTVDPPSPTRNSSHISKEPIPLGFPIVVATHFGLHILEPPLDALIDEVNALCQLRGAKIPDLTEKHLRRDHQGTVMTGI